METKHTITSVTEFIEFTKKYDPNSGHIGYIFRGHADKEWKLIPSLGRLSNYDKREAESFNIWRNLAVAYDPNLPSNDLEALAIAQHHGLATQLLDWTYNPLVALYFAVYDCPEKDGCVIVYAPTYTTTPESFEKDKKRTEILVMIYRPRAISPRILNQKGLFTYHIDASQVIEEENDEGNLTNLKKIIIPNEYKKDILSDLNICGINHSLLFPNLDGLSKHINWLFDDNIFIFP